MGFALRPCFLTGDGLVSFWREKNFRFEFFSGFSLNQKHKSINSFHDEILRTFPTANILEVSRKSENLLGTKLSAFNLKLKFKDGSIYPLENVFQSSKVFENGGPFLDLLEVSPSDAKRDPRIRGSGNLISFCLRGRKWPIEPKTFFYDFLYMWALYKTDGLANELLNYDVFTDIEFNPNRSFNCQARSVAIFVTLYKNNLLDEYLHDKEKFKAIYEHESIDFSLI